MITLGTALKHILGGAVGVVLGVLLWYHGLGNPLDDLALVRHGQIASGNVVDVSDDVDSEDEAITTITYSYRTADGQRLTGKTSDAPSELQQDMKVDVEYLPSNPSLSRIEGTGSQSLAEWVFRTLLSLIILCLFSSIGVMMLVQGVQQARVYVRDARCNALTEWASQIEHLDATTPAYEIKWLYEDGLALQKRFRRERNERLDRMLGLLERAIEMKTEETTANQKSVVK